MEARLRNPARVSARRRALARRVDLKPQTTLGCSRSITRISRSCSITVVCLLPAMEYLHSPVAAVNANAVSDFPFDISSPPCPPGSAAVVQVLIVGGGRVGGGDHNAAVMVMTGL